MPQLNCIHLADAQAAVGQVMSPWITGFRSIRARRLVFADILVNSVAWLNQFSLSNCDFMDLLFEHAHSAPVVFPSVSSLPLVNSRGTLHSLAQSFPKLRSLYLRSQWVGPRDHRLLDLGQKCTNTPQPMPSLSLSSITGNQREVLPLVRFLGHPHPKRHLRRIVLSMSQSGPMDIGAYPGDRDLRNRIEELSHPLISLLTHRLVGKFVRSVPHLGFYTRLISIFQ